MSRGCKMSSTKHPDKSSAAQPHVKYLTNYSSVAHPPLDSANYFVAVMGFIVLFATIWGMFQ
ncbi:hypothetical protein, partial [Corynebacterium sp. CTNIH6]|uniref:hypothetical protein n=1 Tax=Corynebacterium sp. CTNIH6 TaxID=3230066 RepID=UPI001EF247A0